MNEQLSQALSSSSGKIILEALKQICLVKFTQYGKDALETYYRIGKREVYDELIRKASEPSVPVPDVSKSFNIEGF